MSVANRFRQSITKALSLTDIDDENAGQTQQNNKITSESIIAKSVNLFSKFTHSSNNSVNNIGGVRDERRQKTLLVIDGNKEHEWSRVFKGCSLHGIYDVRVEQVALSDLEVKSSSEKGASISMRVVRNGAVIARSLRPDFVLFREYVKGGDLKTDHTNVLLGLMHGLVPSVNSLLTTFNFLQKPVVYAELLKIRQRLGKENFPLIEQNYYQSYYEMLLPPSLPVVIKVGSANSGLGKVCVASPRGFQDVASLVSLTNTYATSESFLEGKFDLRIYKFGQRYKVYKRKSLCDAWKTNTGTSTVEEIALTERYKNWADECAGLFDGLDILSVEVIHTKDDKEYIIEVNNIPPSICPDKREDDMKCIANVVLKKMEKEFPPPQPPQNNAAGNTLTDAIQLISGPPSPNIPRANENIKLKSVVMNAQTTNLRPESAPPNEMNMESRNHFKRALNGGSVTNSNTSLNDLDKKDQSQSRQDQNRRGSLTGRFFSAFES
eukprot:TCONS_00014199-protein